LFSSVQQLRNPIFLPLFSTILVRLLMPSKSNSLYSSPFSS
jgi:hypothetical protein